MLSLYFDVFLPVFCLGPPNGAASVARIGFGKGIEWGLERGKFVRDEGGTYVFSPLSVDEWRFWRLDGAV